MTVNQETYPIEIGGVKRSLRLFEIKPGLKIAILNILGDTELVTACTLELVKKLDMDQFDVMVTAEAKNIPLAHSLSVATGKPYIVLRKSYKVYMGDALKTETVSITTGKPQTLLLDEKDRELLKGKRAAIVDDVISTGSTLVGMREIITKAGGTVTVEAAVFTEGDPESWPHVVALGHLPVFID
ncbi:MAG: adenine phosphoribosyltransferase [Chloroflexi bacterium]|nr:adenine phosphoribosyltransferase [Chloroflexota bacterium]